MNVQQCNASFWNVAVCLILTFIVVFVTSNKIPNNSRFACFQTSSFYTSSLLAVLNGRQITEAHLNVKHIVYFSVYRKCSVLVTVMMNFWALSATDELYGQRSPVDTNLQRPQLRSCRRRDGASCRPHTLHRPPTTTFYVANTSQPTGLIDCRPFSVNFSPAEPASLSCTKRRGEEKSWMERRGTSSDSCSSSSSSSWGWVSAIGQSWRVQPHRHCFVGQSDHHVIQQSLHYADERTLHLFIGDWAGSIRCSTARHNSFRTHWPRTVTSSQVYTIYTR